MPAPIPGRVATQIRVNETIYKKTKLIAASENRTANAQIEYFIKRGVDSYEKEHGVIDLQSDE